MQSYKCFNGYNFKIGCRFRILLQHPVLNAYTSKIVYSTTQLRNYTISVINETSH